MSSCDAAVPATVNVSLEVGAPSESVIVQGGAEVLQSPVGGNQHDNHRATDHEILSPRAMRWIWFWLPGTNTPGRPRTSTINGLQRARLISR
ncbi:MAG: hypothetical protein IPJ07_20390 [Acidobacteria bacterium]|nr:hypothetical protein [Acidobacteriota bacterium]